MAQDHLIFHTNDRSSLKERIVFLVDSVEAATGFSGFGAYFPTLLELDALPHF